MRTRITKFGYLLHGDPYSFSVEQRLFNMACLYAGLIGLSYCAFNFALGLEFWTYAFIGPASLAFLAIYYLVRTRDRFRENYHRFIWVAFLLALGGLMELWFANGGTLGGSQYFLFVLTALSLMILRRAHRWFGFALILAALIGALTIEYLFPESVTYYGRRSQRFIEVSFSLIAALSMLMVALVTLQDGLQRNVKIAQDNRLLLNEDLTLARNLQRKVYEYRPELVADFDLFLRHAPSGILTGDLFDLSRPDPARLRVFLADARGHGINAALCAMIIKSEWVNLSQSRLSPASALNILNRRIITRYDDTVTFTAVVADIYGETLVFSSAGHVNQLLSHGRTVTELVAGGPPLGFTEQYEYSEAEYAFPRDARLTLFTDAFTEEVNLSGLAMGQNWIINILKNTHADSKSIGEALIAHFARDIGQSPRRLHASDDLTVIVAGRQ